MKNLQCQWVNFPSPIAWYFLLGETPVWRTYRLSTITIMPCNNSSGKSYKELGMHKSTHFLKPRLLKYFDIQTWYQDLFWIFFLISLKYKTSPIMLSISKAYFPRSCDVLPYWFPFRFLKNCILFYWFICLLLFLWMTFVQVSIVDLSLFSITYSLACSEYQLNIWDRSMKIVPK